MLDKRREGLYHVIQISDCHFTGEEEPVMNGLKNNGKSAATIVLVLLIIGGPPSGGVGA